MSRARELRDALDKYAKEILDAPANAFRFGCHTEVSTGDVVCRLDHMPDLGDFVPQCGVRAGEVLYSLRASLDWLVYQLALKHAGGQVQKPKQVQFPICDTPADFTDACKRWLQEVHADHVNVIERFQGYHRYEVNIAVGPYFHPLSMLRDLSATDRHRVPLELVMPLSAFRGEPRFTLLLVMSGVQLALRSGIGSRPVAQQGAEIFRARGMAHFNTPPITGLVFPYIGFDSERGAIPVLDKIIRAVNAALDECEQFFP